MPPKKDVAQAHTLFILFLFLGGGGGGGMGSCRICTALPPTGTIHPISVTQSTCLSLSPYPTYTLSYVLTRVLDPSQYGFFSSYSSTPPLPPPPPISHSERVRRLLVRAPLIIGLLFLRDSALHAQVSRPPEFSPKHTTSPPPPILHAHQLQIYEAAIEGGGQGMTCDACLFYPINTTNRKCRPRVVAANTD